MNIYKIPEIDTHTHTVVSGHAMSTLGENVTAARKCGIKGLCLTEHGPETPGGASYFQCHTQNLLPDVIDGIRVYRGIEADILDVDGTLDIEDKYAAYCEWIVASLHPFAYKGKNNFEENTKAVVKALENVNVDIIGHPDDPQFPKDFGVIAKAAKHQGKMLEMNNNSLSSHRPGSLPYLKRLIEACKDNMTPVCVASDTHFYTMVGNVSKMMKLLSEMDFPEDLIMNLYKDRFDSYIDKRKKRLSL